MAKFIVEGQYLVPEWHEQTVEAEDELEAEQIYLEEIRRLAPIEAIDFEIFSVRIDA